MNKSEATAKAPRMVFALAGELVSDWRVAQRIKSAAMRDGRDWIVPQAHNVTTMLLRASVQQRRITPA